MRLRPRQQLPPFLEPHDCKARDNGQPIVTHEVTHNGTTYIIKGYALDFAADRYSVVYRKGEAEPIDHVVRRRYDHRITTQYSSGAAMRLYDAQQDMF